MENKRKANSLTVISHHVKNPVYILQSYLEVISSGDLGELNDSQKKYIKVCLENTHKIGKILESLIYLMEVEEGSYKAKKEKVNIVEIAKKSIEDNMFLSRAGNTKIFLECEKESLCILGDFEKVKAVFDALIENAIKYKKQGEGIVKIIIREENDKIKCSVRDNGVGVAEEEKDRIFQKFYRTQKAIEIEPSSLGLELYINKKIIDDLGGSMWVENNNDAGATFSFFLPIYNNKE